MVYPWLMLAEQEKESSDKRGFYSLSTQKVYELDLPEATGRRCWSSKGWLITLGLDLEIHLLNPLFRILIRLPSQPTIPVEVPEIDLELINNPDVESKSKGGSCSSREYVRQNFIHKAVLSSRPSLSDKTTTLFEGDDDDVDAVKKCHVMAITSQFRKLTMLTVGDEYWEAVECPMEINDVIYFKGKFYAIDAKGRLFICNICNGCPKTIKFADKPIEHTESGGYDYFLVESRGQLFMVARQTQEILIRSAEFPDDEDEDEGFRLPYLPKRYRKKTDGFEVYKLNFSNRKWTQVYGVDDHALFLGNNASFAISPSDQHPGCQPNSIYFTDDRLDNLCKGAGHDMGVFLMDTEEFKSHYDGPDFFSHYSTPLWIRP